MHLLFLRLFFGGVSIVDNPAVDLPSKIQRVRWHFWRKYHKRCRILQIQRNTLRSINGSFSRRREELWQTGALLSRVWRRYRHRRKLEEGGVDDHTCHHFWLEQELQDGWVDSLVLVQISSRESFAILNWWCRTNACAARSSPRHREHPFGVCRQ